MAMIVAALVWCGASSGAGVGLAAPAPEVQRSAERAAFVPQQLKLEQDLADLHQKRDRIIETGWVLVGLSVPAFSAGVAVGWGFVQALQNLHGFIAMFAPLMILPCLAVVAGFGILGSVLLGAGIAHLTSVGGVDAEIASVQEQLGRYAPPSGAQLRF